MTKDINKDKFSEETMLKLSIFSECFREWFPVFINNQFISGVHIFDCFAGSGRDIDGNLGSPLILLNEARGGNKAYCSKIYNKNVNFIFNEAKLDKLELLKSTANDFLDNCKNNNNCYEKCIYKDKIKYSGLEFKDLFSDKELSNLLQNNSTAKFILLDQYGFKEVNNDIFQKLVNSPKTDFIFFISSSFIKRFKDIDAVKKYIDTSKIIYDVDKPKECHREIANYFESLLPESKEYYLHHYTIQKGKNYYGLIFGSNHTLGMEKFLKVCWTHDELAGESNCNINNDFEKDSLFYDGNSTLKKQQVKEEIKEKILSGEINENWKGLKFALKRRCLPKLYVEAIEELRKLQKIIIIGKYNKQATSIHKVDSYTIEVV